MSDSQNKEDISDDVEDFLTLQQKIKSFEEFIKNPGDASQEEIDDAEYFYKDLTRLLNRNPQGSPCFNYGEESGKLVLNLFNKHFVV